MHAMLMRTCQRPERASFISTKRRKHYGKITSGCVNALNGLPSFLQNHGINKRRIIIMCVNALNGLPSFLPMTSDAESRKSETGVSTPWTGFLHFYDEKIATSMWESLRVNALNGLPSFLRYPPRARINTGFAGSFLQVFVWKFWNQAFFAHFLACSQFVHIFS